MDIRKEVFVEEQQVPVSIEIDDLEDKTLHPVGYENPFRLPLPVFIRWKTVNTRCSAIRKVVREKKYGSILMQEIERYIRELGGEAPVPRRSEPCHRIYEKVGYTICGEEYEEGILHHDMDKMIERDPKNRALRGLTLPSGRFLVRVW